MAQQFAGVNEEPGDRHSGKRPRMQVYCDILDAILSGVSKPTHILRKASISWITMTQYLLSLEEKKLVTKVAGIGMVEYHITAKGRQLLNQYRSIQDELKIKTETFL